MRRTIAGLALSAALVTGTVGCGMLTGSDDTTDSEQQQGQAPADGQEADDGQEAGSDAASDGGGAASDGGGAATEAGPTTGSGAAGGEVVATAELEVAGSTVTLDLSPVHDNGSLATAQGVITNTGDSSISIQSDLDLNDSSYVPDPTSMSGWGSHANAITLADPTTGALHTTGYTESGTCLCSVIDTRLEPGDSVVVFAQFAPLDANSTTTTVTVGGFGAFENVPVERA